MNLLKYSSETKRRLLTDDPASKAGLAESGYTVTVSCRVLNSRACCGVIDGKGSAVCTASPQDLTSVSLSNIASTTGLPGKHSASPPAPAHSVPVCLYY